MLLKNSTNKELIYASLVCLVAIFTILPIEFIGIPSGADFYQHYHFALIFHDSIMSGDWIPSWAGYENYGYGGPGIRFYPPIAYYLLALMRFLSGDWYEASWLTFTLIMAVGCFGVYCWSREWLSQTESFFAGAIYACVPNHLGQIYSSFLYAEFVGTAILPFCFLFITKVCKRGKYTDIVGLGFFYALLVLTHLPSAIVGSICFAVYAICLIDRQNFFKKIAKLVASVSSGLLLSSFYWVKMASELAWISHTSEKFSSGHYDFHNQFFPFIFDRGNEEYLARGLWAGDISELLAILLLVPLVISTWLIVRNKQLNHARIEAASFVIGIFGTIMTTKISQPLWEVVPFLQNIQFPSRWMTIVSIISAFSFGVGISYVRKISGLKKIAIRWSLILIVLVNLTYCFTQIVHPTASVPYSREKFSAFLETQLTDESYECWWTIWSKRKAFETTEKVVADGRNVNIISWESETKNFDISEGEAVNARIATFYYPHWKAIVNGQEVELLKDENGVILLPLPKEKSTVSLSFEEPTKVKIAEKISLAAWVMLILVSGFLLIKKFFSPKQALKTI